MAIFQAFFDESGKFKDKHIVSFCGFCAQASKIQDFDDEWKALLRRYGLACLTMKRVTRLKIPFSKNEPANLAVERNAILEPFIQCIRKYFALGIAITVDVAAYEKWPAHAKKKIGGSDDPHYLAFLTAIGGITKFLLADDRASIVCDDDKGTAMNCYQFYQRIRTVLADTRKQLVSICFAEDEEFTPLQGADLLASLCRKEAGRTLYQEYNPFTPAFKSLTAQGDMKWVTRFYGAEYLKYMTEKWSRSH